MKFGKITIIGSGRVGTSAAFALICQNIAKEIALLDINEDVLDAESIDLRDAKYFSYTGHIHKGSWEHAKDSQIIVICAGEVLRPESSLHQVVASNKRCLDDIFRRLGTLHSKCVVVVATSPVDAMTQYAQKLSGLPRNQVLGTGTLLDTQRLRVKLGKKFQINEKSVHAYVMGEKGDTAFVPWSHATIAGRKLTEFFAEDRETQSQLLDTFVDKIKTKTERMLWSKHGTNFGIAACIAAICKDILFDSNSVLPLSCYVNDFDCYMSVLCTLGENGIAKTLPLDLTEMEKQRFQLSANSIWKALKLLGFQNDRFGAVGEEKEWRKEGLEEKTEGLAPGAGFGTEVRGRPMEVPAQEIGGGLGTDIGGFGQTGFQPLQTDLEGGLPPTRQEFKKELGARPYESGTALSSTDFRGFDIGGKTTELGRDLSKETTKLNEDRVGQDLGGGPVGQKLELPTDRGDTGEVGGEKSETGFEKIDIGGTTDIEKKPQTEIGKEISDIGGGLGRAGEASPKLPGMDTSFGGGPTVRGTDIQEGLIKDIGGGEMEKKPLITETQEGRVDEPVGRPIRQ